MDERMYPSARQGKAPHALKHRGGVVVLDGTNPTVVETGLNTIVGATVALGGSVAPALDPSQVTCAFSGGTLSIYAWKVTASGDATLIASTNSARTVNWTAVGT